MRSEAAVDAIREISRFRKDVLIGAGTVLDEAQVDAIMAAGAQFALSPGIDRDVLFKAKKVGIPFAPGIATASELQVALRADCELVKFFPAMSAGGPTMLKDIAAPYLQKGVGFNPTGGVSLANLDGWLAMEHVWAVDGSWIASREDVAASRWEKIAENARQARIRVSAWREVRTDATAGPPRS